MKTSVRIFTPTKYGNMYMLLDIGNNECRLIFLKDRIDCGLHVTVWVYPMCVHVHACMWVKLIFDVVL